MKLALALLIAAGLGAQQFRPLHVTSAGVIADDTGKVVVLRGVNRSGTGSGNAEAGATDQEYAAQNQLLSMNVVRLFVNAAWWTGNVKAPIANAAYQDYIDALIQRAKKYGNYVLVVKAGQFPDPPCGADGKNCPAPNQGDLNCRANAAVCDAQDTTGNNIAPAFTFWAAFAKKYPADPAVLYDTWEDMHGIDAATWSDAQNQLIAAIRTYSPQSLIFVEDTGTAFESIVSGALPDFVWSNLVWNFHVYAGPSGACAEPAASPREANWPNNFDPLVSYAQSRGHGVAITEWGGCNDNDPYHTNVTSYATLHGVALVYFDSSNLLTQSGGAFQLTATGSRVAQAYTALASGPPKPALRSSNPVQDAVNNRTQIVPGSWVALYGSNFSDVTKDWSDQDFSNGLPTSVAGVQVLVNGSPAPVWFVSPGQVNFQAPTNIGGTASIAVARNGVASSPATVNVVSTSPGVISYSSDFSTYYPSAQFAGTANVVGDPGIFGGGVRKARPGDQIVIYVTGLARTESGVVISSPIPFSPALKINIGSSAVIPSFAAQIGAGYYQVNFAAPAGLAPGNYPFSITVDGATSQGNVVLVVGP